MSDCKEEEIALLRREKLASLGQLAASITHEINNPLSFVSSNLDVLDRYLAKIVKLLTAYRKFRRELADYAEPDQIVPLKKLEQELDVDFLLQDVGELVTESRDGASRIRGIVHGLKRLSKFDEAHLEDVDLNEEIELTLKIVEPELKKKAVVNKNLRDIPSVACFPGQLGQVIINLLVNAAQAIEDHGEISVETFEKEDRVAVRVTDTGAGMSPETQARLFEPFYTTKKDIGTGLGLAISQEIVEKHKGRIEVESELGKGTSFTIWLPAGSDKDSQGGEVE